MPKYRLRILIGQVADEVYGLDGSIPKEAQVLVSLVKTENEVKKFFLALKGKSVN